jgi:hypothetical protein
LTEPDERVKIKLRNGIGNRTYPGAIGNPISHYRKIFVVPCGKGCDNSYGSFFWTEDWEAALSFLMPTTVTAVSSMMHYDMIYSCEFHIH